MSDENARKGWDMCQRMAVQIAEKPMHLRDVAFEIAENAVREGFILAGEKDGELEPLVKKHATLLREFVHDIDMSGSPQGGHA